MFNVVETDRNQSTAWPLSGFDFKYGRHARGMRACQKARVRRPSISVRAVQYVQLPRTHRHVALY
jgi:hypothetical protein